MSSLEWFLLGALACAVVELGAALVIAFVLCRVGKTWPELPASTVRRIFEEQGR